MIEAEQADGWTDFRIVGHLMGYLAERAAISDDAAPTRRNFVYEGAIWATDVSVECEAAE